MRLFRTLSACLLLATAAGPLAAAPAGWPTEALAEYVFECMAVNGQTPEMLRRCSCSIDSIAGMLSFDDYQAAKAVLEMRSRPGGGDQVALFRSTQWAEEIVDRLRRAQIEADLACFGR